MVKRSEAGMAVAILVPVVTSILLIQAAERWNPAGTGHQLAGVALWLLAWVCLTVAATLLGRMMRITVVGAGGVAVLGISLGAILKASGASEVVGAALVVTISFVVMASAAAGFQSLQRSRERTVAIALWLLFACMLAGALWTCTFGE
jgi:hypothetical protein